jgi:hypothetical protein
MMMDERSYLMSKSNVPSVPPPRNVKNVLTECQTVEQALADLDRLQRMMPGENWSGRWRVYNDPLHFDFAAARQTLAQVRQACDALPAVIRKATADEIATQLGLLTACFPHQNKDDRQIFARTLCKDVADLKPSVYALQQACRRLRHTSKFLPVIAEVRDALKASMEEEQRLTTHLKTAKLSNMQKKLDEWEQDLPRLEKERAEEEERERQRLLLMAKDFPPEIFCGAYNENQLRLLGLSLEEVERRHKAWRVEAGLAARDHPTRQPKQTEDKAAKPLLTGSIRVNPSNIRQT